MNRKDQAVLEFLKMIYQEKDIVGKYCDLINEPKNLDLSLVFSLKNEHTKIFNEGLKVIQKRYRPLADKVFVSFFYKSEKERIDFKTQHILKCAQSQCLSYERLLRNKYLQTDFKKIIREEIIPRYFTILDMCKYLSRNGIIEVELYVTPERVLMQYS